MLLKQPKAANLINVASIFKRGGSKLPKAVWSVINIAARSL